LRAVGAGFESRFAQAGFASASLDFFDATVGFVDFVPPDRETDPWLWCPFSPFSIRFNRFKLLILVSLRVSVGFGVG